MNGVAYGIYVDRKGRPIPGLVWGGGVRGGEKMLLDQLQNPERFMPENVANTLNRIMPEEMIPEELTEKETKAKFIIFEHYDLETVVMPKIEKLASNSNPLIKKAAEAALKRLQEAKEFSEGFKEVEEEAAPEAAKAAPEAAEAEPAESLEKALAQAAEAATTTEFDARIQTLEAEKESLERTLEEMKEQTRALAKKAQEGSPEATQARLRELQEKREEEENKLAQISSFTENLQYEINFFNDFKLQKLDEWYKREQQNNAEVQRLRKLIQELEQKEFFDEDIKQGQIAIERARLNRELADLQETYLSQKRSILKDMQKEAEDLRIDLPEAVRTVDVDTARPEQIENAIMALFHSMEGKLESLDTQAQKIRISLAETSQEIISLCEALEAGTTRLKESFDTADPLELRKKFGLVTEDILDLDEPTVEIPRLETRKEAAEIPEKLKPLYGTEDEIGSAIKAITLYHPEAVPKTEEEKDTMIARLAELAVTLPKIKDSAHRAMGALMKYEIPEGDEKQ
jgi:hypothetical protein